MSPSKGKPKKAAKGTAPPPLNSPATVTVTVPPPDFYSTAAEYEPEPLPQDYPKPSPVVRLDSSGPVSTHAFHEFQARQNAKIRELRTRVDAVEADLRTVREVLNTINQTLDTIADAITAVLARIEALESGSGEPGTGEYPATVHDLATLKQFVSAEFGPTMLTQQFDGPAKKKACALVRNALSARYPSTIKRLNDDPIGNGYTASETKHSDAFWYVPESTVIDFCSGSDAPGVLNDDLTWRREPINPW